MQENKIKHGLQRDSRHAQIEDSAVTMDLAEVKRIKASLLKENQKNRDSLDDSHSDNNSSAKDLPESQDRNTSLGEQVAAMQDALNNLTSDDPSCSQELTEAKERYVYSEKEVEKLRESLHELNSDNKAMSKELTELKRKNASLPEKVSLLKQPFSDTLEKEASRGKEAMAKQETNVLERLPNGAPATYCTAGSALYGHLIKDRLSNNPQARRIQDPRQGAPRPERASAIQVRPTTTRQDSSDKNASYAQIGADEESDCGCYSICEGHDSRASVPPEKGFHFGPTPGWGTRNGFEEKEAMEKAKRSNQNPAWDYFPDGKDICSNIDSGQGNFGGTEKAKYSYNMSRVHVGDREYYVARPTDYNLHGATFGEPTVSPRGVPENTTSKDWNNLLAPEPEPVHDWWDFEE